MTELVISPAYRTTGAEASADLTLQQRAEELAAEARAAAAAAGNAAADFAQGVNDTRKELSSLAKWLVVGAVAVAVVVVMK